MGASASTRGIIDETNDRRSIDEVLPGVRGSFSASLFAAEPNGEPEIVGERTVGDLGVAEPNRRNAARLFCVKWKCVPDGSRPSVSEP